MFEDWLPIPVLPVFTPQKFGTRGFSEACCLSVSVTIVALYKLEFHDLCHIYETFASAFHILYKYLCFPCKVRIKLLMDFALASGQSILLLGPSGSGKTSLTTDLLKTRGLLFNFVRHCGLVSSALAWDGTGCEFDSWQCRIYIPCSLSLRLLGSFFQGSLGTYGLTQKLC